MEDTIKQRAARIVAAYEADIKTGSAPGITLADLIETEMEQLAVDVAEAVGDASIKVMRQTLRQTMRRVKHE